MITVRRLRDNLTHEAVSTTGEHDRYEAHDVSWTTEIRAHRSVLNIARIHCSRGERIRRTRFSPVCEV